MRPGASTGERQSYASALADLWTGLSRTLARLEAIAAAPPQRLADEDVLDLLPRLQYALHTAGELAHGIDPPLGAERAHAELAAALADARDATGEVVDAVEAGGAPAAQPLVLEWRGALFRVRLARVRLGSTPSAPVSVDAEPDAAAARRALTAVLLVLVGVTAVTSGAMAGAWPLWASGLLLVAGGLYAQRT